MAEGRIYLSNGRFKMRYGKAPFKGKRSFLDVVANACKANISAFSMSRLSSPTPIRKLSPIQSI